MILVSFAPMRQLLVKRIGLVASPNFKITQIELPLYFIGIFNRCIYRGLQLVAKSWGSS